MTIDNKIQKLIKPTQNQAFDFDVITVKRMGHIDKVCYSTSCRQSGVIVPSSAKGSVFNGKLENNIARARSTIQEYALCNKWDYFVTLTIDKDKFNRYNLKEYQKALSKWINNYNRKGCKIAYLLIPEFHKDGAVHMHGLLSSVPESDLCVNKYGYLNWQPYSETFGFISIDKIRDNVATAFYISKYVTKDLAVAIKDCNAHLFYASKGLKKSEHIYKATNSALLAEPTYITEHYSGFILDNTIYDFHDFIDEGNCIYDLISSY